MSVRRPASRRVAVPLLVALALAVAPAVQAAGGRMPGRRPLGTPTAPPLPATGDTWKKVEALASEQKLAEAATLAEARLNAVKGTADQAEWARALIKVTQLRVGLHGYETAVRTLREQPWPKDPLQVVALDLYYAQALFTYLNVYSWEIRQREKVVTKGPVDLKAWTSDQIIAEVNRAYGEAWAQREALGKNPVGALAEYIQPNDYPAGVRGTLRDAVAYLWTEQLSNTSTWSAGQENDVFRLDAAALIAGSPRTSRNIKLDDPEVHPLLKLGAVLDDLEAWHQAERHPAATLEARLERARRLNGALAQESDRRRIRDDLAQHVARARDDAWFAMGKATLAELWRDTGDLVRGRALAQEGLTAFPGSIGGRRCKAILAGIEAPDFALSAMNADGLKRRSVMVQHKNLRALHFRAIPIDLDALIAQWSDYNLLPDGNKLRQLLGRKAAAEWTEALPETPDFKLHQTFVTPPVTKVGLYLIAASVDPRFTEKSNKILGVYFTATGLVITQRRTDDEVELRVVAGDSGDPVAGASVELYRYNWQTKHAKVGTFPTNAQGYALLPGRQFDQYSNHFVVVRKGQDLVFDPNGVSFYRNNPPGETRAALVYTDRAVYRPLQKLLWKVVAYRGQSEQKRYRVEENAQVTVVLRDPNGQEVEKRVVRTNGFGSAAGEFTIPTGRLLGHWTVQTDPSGAAGVSVEEYKRPTFEVSLKDPPEVLRLNKKSVLTGEARYYFGLPVTSGQVRWRVTRAPVYPYWWGWYRLPQQGTQVIATGTSTLEEGGQFKLEFLPQADERESRETSYRYAVSADVTDEGGETRSAERAFRLGWVTVEARIQAEAGFFREGAKAELTVVRTDLDGTPRAGKGSWKLVALTPPPRMLLPAEQPVVPPPASATPDAPKPYFTPGDLLRPRWAGDGQPEGILRTWAAGAERASGRLTHDDTGSARVTLPALPPGAYRFSYETTDAFGATATRSEELLVGGGRATVPLPAALALEAASVTVGGTARFLVQSGLEGRTVVLDLFRGGQKAPERRFLTVGKDPLLIEVPIREVDRGGVSALLTVVQDYQLMTFAKSVYVPYDNKDLKVEFSSFRDRMQPGGKESWRVTVSSATGKPVEAGAVELLAYMYDRSLDLFGRHAPPSTQMLYPQRWWNHDVRSSLEQAQSRWIVQDSFPPLSSDYPSLSGDAVRFYDNYGVGGPGGSGGRGRGDMARMSMAMPAPAPSAPAVARSQLSAEPEAKVSKEESRAADKLQGNDAPPPPPPPPPGDSLQGAQPQGLRSNFSETAFWKPQLLTGPNGSAVIEFSVPDSVTAWTVWVHGLTRDLSGGSLSRESRSVKELMVRPYLPRFLREGDQATLKVVINNASGRKLDGNVAFELTDPDTGASLADSFRLSAADRAPRPFSVGPAQSANLAFSIVAPNRLGPVAVKVVAKAGNVSDGELRPFPVLPSRVHLAQSRFVTLHGKDRKALAFDDLARSDDASRINEELVVTVDAQLFYTALQALPYLVNYPYECTEQTLNRFVSTGIVSSLYGQYPAVAKMAKELSTRETQLETWDAADPNRKMALEESPWVVQAKGGKTPESGLLNVLDPRIARAERESALVKLKKAQTSNGAFPWWPGGPPSPYMTLYLAHGMARAAEYKVEVPKELTQRAWQYLALHYRSEYADDVKAGKACCFEFLTFLNYVASAYPDASYTGDALTLDERKAILDFSFKHWKQHSPYLKGYLALTLKRMGRPADANKVWDSVMDSAKTTEDQGTFWAAEDRSWLWYNDTVETQAFALQVLMELRPKDPRREGLVQWLLLNKKLSQWKSTRATAEAIYGIAKYLVKENALGVRENAKVSVNGKSTEWTFEPDSFTGKKNQVVVPGPEVSARTTPVIVEKTSPGLAFASATWRFSTEQPPAEDRGDFFSVSRRYFKREKAGKEVTLRPLADGEPLHPGDEVEVQLSLRTKHAAEFVHLRDPRAAGLEPENATSRYKWDLGINWYEEIRDSGSNFFFEWLPVGEYTFKYRLRANLAGTFKVGPATVQSLYAPEFNAYSTGAKLVVSP